MSFCGPITFQQVTMLRNGSKRLLHRGGILTDPAKEHFSRRLMSLFRSGIFSPSRSEIQNELRL